MKKVLEIYQKLFKHLTPFHEFIVNYDSNGTILGVTNFTKWAHQYGLAVYPFTFRQDYFPGNNFEHLIEYFWRTVQVDGFITDHPDVILQYFQRAMSSGNSSVNLRLPMLILLLIMIVLIIN